MLKSLVSHPHPQNQVVRQFKNVKEWKIEYKFLEWN